MHGCYRCSISMLLPARRRARDEARKPLASYRQEELQHMQANMMLNNWGFHEKRRAFVHKHKPTSTCPAIALHTRSVISSR
jgi:putative two-component system hydrogenase maturation factor HypX/HoxX